MAEEYITIGKVVNTQGNKGCVRVLPLTDFPERFYKMEQVIVFSGAKRSKYQIEKASPHKKYIILKFKEINEMNTAADLKGALLQVTRDQLVSLPPDTFYVFELINLDVYTAGGEYLGKIQDVLKTGANDVYVVKAQSINRSILIPALKQVVKEVDIKNKRLVIEPLPGLFD
jgi:16S rRNA processing protein RimM